MGRMEKLMNHASLLMKAILAVILTSISVTADWSLDAKNSNVSFVTIKASEIAEAHHFKTVNGSVAENGSVNIAIDLASVETNIDIRNERMQKFLFEVVDYPTANVTAMLDLSTLEKELEDSNRTRFNLPLELSLHGVKSEIDADVYVTKLGDDQILVETAAPILIHADDFGLLGGVAKLMELAGLDAISPAVPVSVSLIFKK